jgi:hypothetical protein
MGQVWIYGRASASNFSWKDMTSPYLPPGPEVLLAIVSTMTELLDRVQPDLNLRKDAS